MFVYDPAGYLAVLLIAVLLIATPVFVSLDKPWHEVSQRNSTIDGLRGYLAMAVFLHHGAIYDSYMLNGNWIDPPSQILAMLGTVGVAMFFMVTGFLFWGKAVRACGTMRWRALVVNRVFRIAPLYYVATVVMLMIVFADRRWSMLESVPKLFSELAPLVLFGFYGTGPDIDTYHQPWILLAGVTWTLRYEWVFYLVLLPLAAQLLRRVRAPLGIPLAAALAMFALAVRLPSAVVFGIGFFAAGMITAALHESGRGLGTRLGVAGDLIAIALLVAVLGGEAKALWGQLMMLGVAFHLIATGSDLFGLLSLRASRRLGEISYGIYILQGLVLHATYAGQTGFAAQSPLHFWLVLAAAGASLIAVATLAHITIESPAIRCGRSIAKFVQGAIRP
ncbi:MAG: acyltransferase [Proteobacteria bacterium]|nr:acyltransferase [Pseudomonadota bacterium]